MKVCERKTKAMAKGSTMRDIISELDQLVGAITKFQDFLNQRTINRHTMQEVREMNEQASKATLTQAEIACLFGRDK